MDTPRRYFWQRLPAWLGRLLLGSVVAMAVLAGLVGGLALWAQRAADPQALGEHYSVTMHALAMIAVGALTVAVVTGLARLGATLLAGVVLVGSVVGPMTLVAVPVRASWVDVVTGDTQAWWHAAVAAVLGVLLAVWTWWVTQCLRERSETKAPAERSPWALIPQAALFAAAAVAGVATYDTVPVQSNEPVLRAIIGWVLLAAGIVVVATFARTAWTSFGLLAAVAAALGMVFLAYTRIGGWPGVAGWEVDGIQSPIITSVASTGTLLVAPLLGLVGWALRRGTAQVMQRVDTTAEALSG